MTIRTNPSLGPNIDQVVTAGQSWYDGVSSPQTGDTCYGDDGRLRMWVKASGAIAAAASPGTQVTLTVNGPSDVTAAAGTGGWYAPPSSVYATALASGDHFWATKGTAP